jgi:hypothetical protein
MPEKCQSNLHFVTAGKFTIWDCRHYIRSHNLLKHTYTITLLLLLLLLLSSSSSSSSFQKCSNDISVTMADKNANNWELVQV